MGKKKDEMIKVVRHPFFKHRQLIHTGIFQRTDISFEAKGLWAYLTSLPDDSSFLSSKVLKAENCIALNYNIDTGKVIDIFNELIDEGYLEYSLVDTEDGPREIYNLNETPFDREDGGCYE